VALLLEELPYPSDPSVGGLPYINVLWHSYRRSLRLLPLFLPLLPYHLKRAYPRAVVKSPFSHLKMPARLIAADDWRPSSMTECQLLELEREGLLHPRTSSSRLEWIAPAADHREQRPPMGYVVSITKFHRHGLGSPLSRFMRALCHHYGVELQHFSPNAVTTAAVFATVCEGYLGMMPHWDLWLHLYRGKLFNAPSGTTGVRKPVRAGCLNLVLKTGKLERPREYIPVGLTLLTERRRPLPRLHRALDLGAPGPLEIRRCPSPPTAARPHSRHPKEAA